MSVCAFDMALIHGRLINKHPTDHTKDAMCQTETTHRRTPSFRYETTSTSSDPFVGVSFIVSSVHFSQLYCLIVAKLELLKVARKTSTDIK